VNYFQINLKYLRQVFEVGQETLAAIVHKSRNTISNWQTGVSEPNIDELIKLARFFHIRLDIFIMINIEKEKLVTDEHILEFSKKGTIKKDPVEYDTTDLPASQLNEPDEPLLVQVLGELKKLNGNVGRLRIEVKKKMN
jgi:DNA-binding XRE family transcriptional regulator